MKPLTRLEDEPPFGAIFLQLNKSAFLNLLTRATVHPFAGCAMTEQPEGRLV